MWYIAIYAVVLLTPYPYVRPLNREVNIVVEVVSGRCSVYCVCDVAANAVLKLATIFHAMSSAAQPPLILKSRA